MFQNFLIKKNIKAVVFDYGGVIEINQGGNLFEDIAQLINIPVSDFRTDMAPPRCKTNLVYILKITLCQYPALT